MAIDDQRLHLDRRATEIAEKFAALHDDQLVDLDLFCSYLGITRTTERGWRERGIAPPHQKFGPRVIRYKAGDVRKWLEMRTQLRTEYDEAARLRRAALKNGRAVAARAALRAVEEGRLGEVGR